ncbi:hypothetical protein JOL79_23540 [Microbispora sp. RL4-1S]|uniref:Uncharacterized protein n=1 Tax=Microbispora oryzae TaxID=2806554 RepID=A0A940WST5_9ACTN|nr:hypothetical protein [Microbispora oryzae]MBP2706785.1 hypothetical protein [Microbispora oryzae]
MSEAPEGSPPSTPRKRGRDAGAQNNDRTKRAKTIGNTPPAGNTTSGADQSGPRTRSRSGSLVREPDKYVILETGYVPDKPLAKRKPKVEKRVTTADAIVTPAPVTTTTADVDMTPETVPDPVVITPTAGRQNPGDRPDIALVTFDPVDPDYLAGDYLYQVLVKIRDSPIFTELLATVTGQAPDDWQALVAQQENLPEPDRAAEEDVLARIAKVPASVGIVVVDGADFPGLTADYAASSSKARYNSTLHFIDHAQNDSTNAPTPLQSGGNYFAYLHGIVFELCNASQRQKMISIETAAADGLLDCVSYCLAKESQEVLSENLHDTLVTLALKDTGFLNVVDDVSNAKKTLKPPALGKMLYSSVSGSRAARLKNSVDKGHALQYVTAWKDHYWAKYAEVNPKLAAAFEDWTNERGEAPEIDHRSLVLAHTGIEVDDSEVSLILEHVNQTFQHPLLFNPGVTNSTDTDFGASSAEPERKPVKKNAASRGKAFVKKQKK